MIKKLFLFLFTFVTLLISNPMKITPPDEAFKVSFEEKNDFLFVNIDLASDVYLLDEMFIFETAGAKKHDFTNEVQRPKGEIFKEKKVYFKHFEGVINLQKLSQKEIFGKTKINVTFQGCAAGGIICYPPMTKSYEVKIKKSTIENGVVVDESEHGLIAKMLYNKSFLLIVFSFFIFGLLLSLTPCVLPMIPILSSIIVKQSGAKMSAKRGFLLSFIYVFSMAIAYTLAGVIAGLFGANMQVILQNPWVIGTFSFIFVLLALSMFGFYKLELPQSLQSKLTKAGNQKGGILGVAIMGFLSALIVGPCVAAPLAGALMYIGQSGDALLGGVALFVMSFGMGVPLLVIGASAGKLLPKPGIWMDRILNIFGIVMLGVAIWMVERVIPLHVSIILWSFLFIFCGIYFGAIEPLKSGDIKEKFVKTFAFIVLIYGVIVFVGGVNKGESLLNPLSGFGKGETITQKLALDFLHVKSVNELNSVIENAQKPIMIEFTASWCVVCKEFEEKTLSQKSVQDALQSFTLVKIDVTKNSADDKELMSKFSIYGPPAIMFFKEKKELKNLQIFGFKNEKEFLEILRRVHE
ncbi:MAG: protein-disulfide reductase DsbD [Campylobacteraceae bacterium]